MPACKTSTLLQMALLSQLAKRLDKQLLIQKNALTFHARSASTKLRNPKMKYFLKNDAPAYRIGVTKSWDSRHTGGIQGSLWAHDRFIDDVMIRKFIEGTFYELLVSDVIIKRTLNYITVSIFVSAKGTTVHKVYFLSAFSERLLSHMFGCVVKMEIMSVPM